MNKCTLIIYWKNVNFLLNQKYRDFIIYCATLKTEAHTPNDEYENFVNAPLEATTEFIPTKQSTKPRVPWEILAVGEVRADVKTASKYNRKNPTNTNTNLKEQAEYRQNQIDKIRNSVEDRQSRIAWQTVNQVSRRKSTAKA